MDKEAREHLAKELEAGNVRFLKSEDSFEFGCTACGGCCFGLTVLLNPMDVYMMSRSKMARNTYRVRWTHDLLTAGLVHLNRGPESRFPIATIEFRPTGKRGTDRCPFLIPKCPDRHDLSLLNGLDIGGVRRYTSNGVHFVCGLHEEGLKPAICRLSPLGRTYELTEDKKELNPRYIWYPATGACPGVRNKKPWTLEQYLRESRLDVVSRYSQWWYGLTRSRQEEVKAMDEETCIKFGLILYDLDFIFMGVSGLEEKAMEAALAAGDVPSRKLDEGAYFEALKSMVDSFFAALDKRERKEP